MLKLGDQSIAALRLGGTEIKKAYLGEAVVFNILEPPVPAYTIVISIDPAGAGTVSGSGSYQEGENVTITAAPKEGYQFIGWQEDGVTVSESASYTFTVTRDRTLTAVFAVASRLPAGYTEAEYIQTGTSLSMCIGPSIVPSNTRIVLDVDIPLQTVSNSPIFYANDKAYFYLTEKSVATSVNVNAYISTATSVNANITGRHSINFDGTRGKMFVDSSSYSIGTVASGTFTAGVLYLGRKSGSRATPDMKIYSVKIYTSGNLMRDLIPCKNSSGSVGLYDLVGATFYRGGTSAGPAV